MSERFEVPEPSAEAAGAYRAKRSIGLASVEVSLRAAYAVDVVRIVRAEVERALREECRIDDSTAFLPRFDREQAEIRIAAYLSRRFGEPPREEGAEHFEGCCLDTDHKGPCLKRCVPESGATAPPEGERCQHGCFFDANTHAVVNGCPDHDKPFNPTTTLCTACGCGACQDLRAFVKAQALREYNSYQSLPPSVLHKTDVWTTARKVVG